MKILTFLGAGTAYETAYVMPDGREYKAPYCGAALARFYPDADIRVFVTKEARETHYERFFELTEDLAHSVEAVDIPAGKEETQLWEIFQAVVEHVDDKEEVVFDITHGFRSLPFLSFLAAAYLREVKDISLKAVLYGNFEARDRSVTPNRAPVIDMTSFVDLLDWTIAADRFTRFGDARDLATRLRSSKPAPHRLKDDPTLRKDVFKLNQAAQILENTSLALRLIRPHDAMDASEKILQALPDSVEIIAKYAQPFKPLAQRVISAYAPLAMSKEDQKADPIGALERERDMIQWYLNRGQYVQATALAREWLISWFMSHLGFTDLVSKKPRDEVESVLQSTVNQRRNSGEHIDDHVFSTCKRLKDIPELDKALTLYDQIGNARNDLLHAGKRAQPFSAKTLETKIRDYALQLQKLPLVFPKESEDI